MPTEGRKFFDALGVELLQNRRPSKPTIFDGKHVRTEDERAPGWRKEVCEALSHYCSGVQVSDELAVEIRKEIDFEPNLLSVRSRNELVVKITTLVVEAYRKAEE